MRVFVTGATGFIGSAIVQELLGAGHQVLGLARSDAGAAALAAAGADVHRGSLEDLDSLKAGASAADGVIHTAFIHDFSDFAANCEIDRKVVTAFGDVLAGSDRPLLVTSGTALVSPGRLATEKDIPVRTAHTPPRIASDEAAMAAAARGVRASILRMSPSVHGKGDHGFVPMLIRIAREKGVSAYIGEGRNRWPGVHRLDAASLYRLALEKGVAGARYHGVADEGVPTKQIAEIIGRHLGLPVVSQSTDEAAAHFGWIAHFFGLDCPASSALTQAELGWTPRHEGLLADLEQGHYFAADYGD
ncbi:MAG: SDR family oxidoreductase [Luteibacter sp.]